MSTKIIILSIGFLILYQSANSQRVGKPIDWNETRKEFVNNSFIFYEIRKPNNGYLADTASTKTIQFKNDSVFVYIDGVIQRGTWKNAHMDFYVIDSGGTRVDYDCRAGSSGVQLCFSVQNNERFTECYKKVK